jgi:hypothetical protein
MTDLTIVEVKNLLANDIKRIQIKSKIINRIKELGLNLVAYRMNNELLLLILNLIEHLVLKKDKINKKELAIEIINELFQLTPPEKQTISDNIEFLWINKAIKKVSFWKLFKAGMCEWFFKKKG